MYVANMYLCMYVLGLKQIIYFDIRKFFYFQTNSPNILLHNKSGKMILFSVNL